MPEMLFTLFDENPESGAALRGLLESAGLTAFCAVKEQEILGAENPGGVLRLEGPGVLERFEKPVRAGIVLDRLRRNLRETSAPEEHKNAVGPYVLDSEACRLIDPETGRHIDLTEKERDILVFLTERKGQTVPRDLLLREIWRYGDNIETHTLETHIYRLRRKIEKNPAGPDLLLTDKEGYILAGQDDDDA
ncbi:MAG: helix-turn-helix domain-containing protein [Alphaproteobacteria bacterium]|nr:helix-turn-helix domain-containing protein [Alphaproteobacteria bacterium]